MSFQTILVSILLSSIAVGQTNTAVLRSKISQDFPTNNGKAITAAKLRSVLSASADAIDEIYNNISLADRIGVYNASTGIATVSATGATQSLVSTPSFPKGKYFDVVVGGTNTLTGVSTAWGLRDIVISTGNKWDRIPASSNITDPKQSPNLVSYANQNSENWGMASSASITAPKVYRQTGNVTLSIEKNQKGLGFWAKGVLDAGSRYNFISNDIALDVLPVGSRVMMGCFLYLKPGTVLDATTRATIYRTTGGGETTVTTEMVDLGGGLYYLRSTAPFQMPSYTGTAQLRIYVLTDATSPASSEVWLGAPSLVKSETVLSPQIYTGADYVNFGKIESFVSEKLNINGLLDVGFRKQAVGATSLIAPWSITSAATSTTFAASYLVETVPDGPIGAKAIKVTHFKNSADSKSSDFQLTQRVAIPATFVGADKISFGFWMKRSSVNISFIDAPIIFYDSVLGGTPTTVSTPPSYISSGVNEWTYVRYENISVPANSQSVSVRIRSQCLSSAPTNTNYYLWMQAPQLSFGSPTANAINLGVADDAALAVESGLASAFDLPVLPNGNFANGVVSHSFLTGATFLPEYALFDTLTPIGTKAIKVLNTKRVSDNALSILRDYIEISVVAGEKTSISFSFLWKGDPAFINAFAQIEFRTASASISTSTGTFTTRQDLPDGWYRIYLSNVSIPATATIIRCSARMEAKSAATAGSLYTSYHVGHMAAFGNSIPIFSTTKYTDISTKLVNDASFTAGLSEKVSPINYYGLKGKKVGFYGNSIIAANVNTAGVIQPNREVDLLVKKFGIIPYVRGVGGTRVVDNGSTAWFAADGLYLNRPIAQGGTVDSAPAGSVGGLIPSALSTAERIATIPTDTEILYIRVGTNDYINYPVGNIYSPHDQTTFAGAYMLMLDRISARIPNAIIILSTPIHRDGEDTAVGTGLADGVRFEAVREVIRAIAKKEKLKMCDMANTGINQRNHGTYLSDGIHPLNAGYYLMYTVIAETFKNIYP